MSNLCCEVRAVGSNPAGGTSQEVPIDPVISGDAECGVLLFVQPCAGLSRRMSRSVDEAWTGSRGVAAGEVWESAGPPSTGAPSPMTTPSGPPATTRGPISSTAPSPLRLSGYGSGAESACSLSLRGTTGTGPVRQGLPDTARSTRARTHQSARLQAAAVPPPTGSTPAGG